MNDQTTLPEPVQFQDMVCGFFRFFGEPSFELPSEDSDSWNWSQSGASVFARITRWDELLLCVKLKKIRPRKKQPELLYRPYKAWIYEIVGLDKLNNFPTVVYAIWVEKGIDFWRAAPRTTTYHDYGFIASLSNSEEFGSVRLPADPDVADSKHNRGTTININSRFSKGHLIDPGELYDMIVSEVPKLGKKRKRFETEYQLPQLEDCLKTPLTCGNLMCTCRNGGLTIL